MFSHSRSQVPEKSEPGNGLLLLGSLGLGAALMYFCDPQAGRRRRALLRDQCVHFSRKLQEAERVVVRDAAHRAQGLMAEATRYIKHEGESPDDAVLRERVRAALGRAVSHPHAIEVSASQGSVTLRGPVLADEVDTLMSCVECVRGVQSVRNELTAHEDAGRIPALQGGVAREGDRVEWMQRNWSPSARVLAGALGGILATFGFLRGGGRGLALGTIGGALLARAATNREMASLVGMGARARPIAVQKTIHINAPTERVFEFWANFENFPRWMSHVRAVHDEGANRYHWRVDGPGGVPVEWHSRLTHVTENRELAWASEPGSMVDHSGRVRFESEAGGTRVHVNLWYVPIGGALGHAVAKMFGADPKSGMDADLMRFKTMVETGREPHDGAARVQAEEAPTALPPGVQRH